MSWWYKTSTDFEDSLSACAFGRRSWRRASRQADAQLIQLSDGDEFQGSNAKPHPWIWGCRCPSLSNKDELFRRLNDLMCDSTHGRKASIPKTWLLNNVHDVNEWKGALGLNEKTYSYLDPSQPQFYVKRPDGSGGLGTWPCYSAEEAALKCLEVLPSPTP